eukprot:scaffold13308_cov72-Skeletonema_dohrnii-CCMP3373.AAC.3
MGCRCLRSGWFETAQKKDITRKIALDADTRPTKNVRWNGVCFRMDLFVGTAEKMQWKLKKGRWRA